MKKYVLADGTNEKRQEVQGLREAGCIEQGRLKKKEITSFTLTVLFFQMEYLGLEQTN